MCVCHGLTPSPPSPPHIGVTCTVASALKAANHSSTALWLPFLGGKGGQNPSDTAHPPSICSLTKMPVVISKTDWVDFSPKKTKGLKVGLGFGVLSFACLGFFFSPQTFLEKKTTLMQQIGELKFSPSNHLQSQHEFRVPKMEVLP